MPKPCAFEDADAVVEALLRQLEEHPRAHLIAVFDNLEHAWQTGGDIPPDVLAIRNMIFCFGTELPVPELMALGPRTIVITEQTDRFTVSYMETPVPEFNDTMAQWLNRLPQEIS
jgi:hypothetical protein